MLQNADPLNLCLLKVSCADCTLRELCLPRRLEPIELTQLEGIVRHRRPLQRGEVLYRRGEPLRALYAIHSGSVKVHMPASGGGEQVMGFHLPGNLLGLDGCGTDSYTCTAIALETTSICELPYARLESLCALVPGLNREFRRLMGRVIGAEQAMLLMLGNKKAEERLASFLIHLSRRYCERGFSPLRFNLSMSRHDIGNYLGLALETVSRQFAHFQEAGWISVDRREVSIHQLDALEKLVTHTLEEETGNIA